MAGLLIDIAALTLMLHANGGPSIQLSMLYLVVVVAAYVLVNSRQAMVITVFAIICVIYQQFFYAITKQMNTRGLSNVALLGLSFIGTAMLSNLATRQLRTVERIASQQAKQMQQLNNMNQRIIETMQNGVMVIDHDFRIQLCNKAAQKILGLRYARPEKMLAGVDLQFADVIERAIARGQTEVLFTPKQSRIHEALAITVHQFERENILLNIERISRSQQQAQQLKLAALGRLTASIAHEIRNPIGAISQASQLLAEEEDDPNTPIYQIIHKQTQRVNQIIEDVLRLSRQSAGEQTQVKLNAFMAQFIDEHFSNKQVVTQMSPHLNIYFNPNQLAQILINLVENGLHHGLQDTSDGHVQVVASEADGQVTIDVIDGGEGISVTDQDKIFEPFFTTASTGTGLGLYLSKAFAEANGATLTYIPSQQGTCFRLSKMI